MRTTTWYYIRSGEGLFRSISGKGIRAFQAGKQALAPNAEGYVCYVQLYVQWENRRPAALYGSEFLRFLVSEGGIFNQTEWAEKVARLLAESYMDLSKFVGTNLIDASCRFAERRYRHQTTWQPSSRDITALSLLVRKRLQKAIAGR